MKERLVVGAKKRPDGTLDLSKAVSWRGPAGKTVQPSDAQPLRERTIDPKNISERERSRERAAELVLRDGGIRVYTSIEKGLSPGGTSGFQTLETRIQSGGYSSAIKNVEAQFLTADEVYREGKRLDDSLERHKIREIIDISPEVEQIYKEIITSGGKGVFGIGKTPDKITRQPTGTFRPKLHNEIVEGGKNEPAMRITYYIPQQADWEDYSGRRGQTLSVEIVLPESTVKEVEKILDRDPAAIRVIVERVMKKKLLNNPDAWDSPQGRDFDGVPLPHSTLKPPYDKWDAQENGGRIYLQKAEAKPGFHQEFVRKTRQ